MWKSDQRTDNRFDHISELWGRFDALRVLVPSVNFKKREKNPWRSVNFSKVAGFSLQLY